MCSKVRCVSVTRCSAPAITEGLAQHVAAFAEHVLAEGLGHDEVIGADCRGLHTVLGERQAEEVEVIEVGVQARTELCAVAAL
jgi:hypothetical protein